MILMSGVYRERGHRICNLYHVHNYQLCYVFSGSLAYRFFPILLLFTIVLIVALNRDFGIMLTAERKMLPPPSQISTSFSGSKVFEANKSVLVQEDSHGDVLIDRRKKDEDMELRGAGGSPAPSGEIINEGIMLLVKYSYSIG